MGDRPAKEESLIVFPALLPTYNRTDVAFVRGEGSYLFAEDGKRYLDFGAGIAGNAFGHAHPRMVKALTEQAGKLWHTSNLYRVPGQESLSQKLVANTFADTCFFTNSGTEAIELAIKMGSSIASVPELVKKQVSAKVLATSFWDRLSCPGTR